MPVGAQLLIVAIVLCWAWLVTHVALVVRALSVREITRREWWFALLVPLFTPFIAWQHGKRKHVVLWVSLLVLYAACYVAMLQS